jgi:inorganic pyrophosphatase
VPETVASDGEELDALVIVSEPTFPGCLVRVRPVGLLLLKVDGHPDENLVCVPLNDPNWNAIEGLSDLGDQLTEETESFFVFYKGREGKDVERDRWSDADDARRCIEKARERSSDGSDSP